MLPPPTLRWEARVFRVVVLILILIAMTGCGMVRSTRRTLTTRPPVATIDSVAVADRTDEGARIEATVLLQNPNPQEHLPLVRAEYEVSVAGKTYAYRDVPMRTLPAAKNSGHQQVVLIAAVPTGGRDLTGAAYSVTGRIFYEPPGEV